MTEIDLRSNKSNYVNAECITFNVYSDRSGYEVQFKARFDTTLKRIVESYMSRQGYTANSCNVYKMEKVVKEGNGIVPLNQNTLGESGVKDGDNLYIVFK